jgi:hypothetical protein
MMLVWAQEKGFLADIPLPKAELKKGRAQDGNDTNTGEPAADAAQGN